MHRQQSGYALLLMLFVLLSTGITGLSRTLGSQGASAQGFTAGQYTLQTARQALLSYAALYPYLYGPRGAGPGHLPCPDTDDVLMASGSQSSSREGPNPPCGSDAMAAGKLPRHVNLLGHRYVFHVEPIQRLAYLVSSDMINNPVNRIVNDDVLRADKGALPFVAWVRQAPVEKGRSTSAVSQIPISRQSLLPGVVSSVAAWFVQQVNQQHADVCSPASERGLNSSRLHGLDVLSLIAENEPGSMTELSIGLDAAPDSCLDDTRRDVATEDRLLEGVPLASHWFVRNAWHDRIVIQASESCASAHPGTCRLVSSPSELPAVESDERLYFIWQAIS